MQTNHGPSADTVASLLGGWSTSAHGTLARRLGQSLRNAIAAGLIADGARLPPERALATALAVSRSTVSTALDDLRADGLLESRQGRGHEVRSRPQEPASTRIAQHFLDWDGIDLAAGNPPDPGHWPPIRLDVADLIALGGPGVLPLGLPALREALAAAHSEAGLPTDIGQIHVTSGAHQAIALLVRSHVGAGGAVAVEDTSYPGIFDIVDSVGALAVPIRADAAGLVPEALDEVLTERQPGVLYVQSGPHNPTGRVTAPGRLRALARVIDRHDTTVIEDAALADLTFAGRPHPELANLCRRAVVISVGSFSKVAWGGLRVGWFRGPRPLVERTMHLRLAGDLGSSVPAQVLALRLLPDLEELAVRRRATLSANVERALEHLADDLPEWTIREPQGGSVLWPELPVADAGPFVQLAGRHGVHVAPGSIARALRAADPHVRVCVDRPWELVEVGLQRLGQAWRESVRRRPIVG